MITMPLPPCPPAKGPVPMLEAEAPDPPPPNIPTFPETESVLAFSDCPPAPIRLLPPAPENPRATPLVTFAKLDIPGAPM